MVVNELVGKIEARIKELGKLSTDRLRYEHPYAMEGDTLSLSTARRATQGKSREDIIAEIITEEFSLKYDLEIES